MSSDLRGSRSAPGVRWSPSARRYVDAGGRFVSAERVLEAQRAEALAAERRALDAVTAYNEGRLTRTQLQRIVETSVRRAHHAQAALERGGFAQMSRADLDAVRANVREQLVYLQERLLPDIESGRQLADATLARRVAQYVRSARGGAASMRRRMNRQAGASLEINVLGRADHCEASKLRPGCLDLTKRGPQPIGTLPLPGKRTCLHNCGCRVLSDLDLDAMPALYRRRMERALASRAA